MKFHFCGEPDRTKNEDNPEVTDREYYRALYHLVTHWAAVVVMLVLLLTMGVLIPSPSPAAVRTFRAAIGVVTLLSLYFLCRMHHFGNIPRQQGRQSSTGAGKVGCWGGACACHWRYGVVQPVVGGGCWQTVSSHRRRSEKVPDTFWRLSC